MMRMNIDDPKVRYDLIESGIIWNLWDKAIDLAIEDLIAGRAPINEWTPGEVVAYVREQRGEESPVGEEPVEYEDEDYEDEDEDEGLLPE
jgi:hypothetical protein